MTHRTHLFIRLLGIATVCAGFAFPTLASAQEVQINITQVSPIDVLGDWSLQEPDETAVSLNDQENYTVTTELTGKHTLIINPPTGMTTVITVLKNGVTEATYDIPRFNFHTELGDVWDIQIVYTLKNSGEVSASSDPPGIPFTITGPDGIKLTGVTPAGFEPVPVGAYSVEYHEVVGCPTAAKKSDQLVKNQRVSFTVTLTCSAEARERLQPGIGKSLEFVTIVSGGQSIVLEDVPLSAWFATYVHNAARLGIMSGYNDESGNPAGKFGPEDIVTMAQLSKIAHEAAGINEAAARGELQNKNAADTWFESYYRSAEQRWWLVYRNYFEDPSRPATRAEVIATMMQAFDVPVRWPKGKIFSDVSPTLRYADAIETAATDCLITGVCEKTEGRQFKPSDPINRAELAKIVSLAIEKYTLPPPEEIEEQADRVQE